MKCQSKRILVTVLGLLPALAARAQMSFRGLGIPAGYDASSANSVSADGRIVVGDISSGNVQAGFRWSEATGIQLLFPPGGEIAYSSAEGVSATGNVIVGGMTSTAGSSGVYRWTSGSTTSLPAPNGSTIYIPPFGGVSGDGQTVVGSLIDSGSGRAALWSANVGWRAVGGIGSEFLGISADGSTAVGDRWSSETTPMAPVRWTASEGIVDLSIAPGGVSPYGYAFAASSDGSVIVGGTSAADAIQGEYEAVLWTRDGAVHPLGFLPGAVLPAFSIATGVSADGRVVVGMSDPTGPFVWDPDHGMRSLTQLLLQAGISEVSHWRLDIVSGVSADGSTIVGNGTNPQGRDEAWLVRIGDTCYANCDGSTAAPVLNIGDFMCFLNRFAADDPYANCDGSATPPVLNVNDFSCFLNRFAAGCP